MSTNEMTVKEIVKKWLFENGFDGLYYDDCGCYADDLFLCDAYCGDCQGGYRRLGIDGDGIYQTKTSSE